MVLPRGLGEATRACMLDVEITKQLKIQRTRSRHTSYLFSHLDLFLLSRFCQTYHPVRILSRALRNRTVPITTTTVSPIPIVLWSDPRWLWLF